MKLENDEAYFVAILRGDKMEHPINRGVLDENLSRGRSKEKVAERKAKWLHSANITKM